MRTDENEPLVGFIPYGGLGNQLFQFATALSLQNEGNRRVAIDLVGNERMNLSEMPEIFDFQIEDLSEIEFRLNGRLVILRRLINLQLRLSNKVFQNRFLNVFLESFQGMFSQITSAIAGLKVLSPRGLGWDLKLKIPRNDFTILGNFHSYLFISEKVRAELRNRLKSRNFSEAINTFEKLAIDEKPVAIHIRLGDYLSISELNVINPDYFARAIQLIETECPRSNYWIFTNDEFLARQYIPTTISKRIRFIPQSLNSAQTIEVMWLCSSYIISNSTFSWWGAFLSRTTNPVVIAPSKWFKTTMEPKFICPKDWKRI